jgi:hypothetical protein
MLELETVPTAEFQRSIWVLSTVLYRGIWFLFIRSISFGVASEFVSLLGCAVSLISAVAGGERSASRPDLFTAKEKAPGAYWIGGWGDPLACLDDLEKIKFLTLLRLELQPLSRPARIHGKRCILRNNCET